MLMHSIQTTINFIHPGNFFIRDESENFLPPNQRKIDLKICASL
jgi:hypothetical protein